MKYVCTICGYIYDEARGIPDAGISPGTKWEELPDDWTCPLCGAAKSDFRKESERKTQSPKAKPVPSEEESGKELSAAQMSALCSNLAKGCTKQYLQEEASLFFQLADYYKEKAGIILDQTFESLLERINRNLEEDYGEANEIAGEKPDRGALRALVWSEKVTRMLNSILSRYEKEKESLLEHTNVFVCEICGFIYIGDEPPEICPVCKVPRKKLTKVERG